MPRREREAKGENPEEVCFGCPGSLFLDCMGWGSCILGREVQPAEAVKRVATRPVGRGLWPWAAPLLLVAASCASYPPLKGRVPEGPGSGPYGGNPPTYREIETHLRSAERLRKDPDRRQEALDEYHWVLEHTRPGTTQHTLAKAGKSLLDKQVGYHYPGTIRRAVWGALAERPREMDRHSGMWKWITVHHSAMEVPARVLSSQPVGQEAVRGIQTSHMNGRGYGDIGYHFLVDPAGRVYEGRSLQWQGAHAKGKNNVGNIGICLLGNFENAPPTRQAQAALHSLVASLRSGFAIGTTHVVGHGHWTSTKCPGRHLTTVLNRYH